MVPPTVDDFVYISDYIYSKEQIIQMEMDVCDVLKFHLQHATPVKFAHEYLLASQTGLQNASCEAFHPMLKHLVYYLLELGRMSYELVSTKPSLLAAAAVFLARAALKIRCHTSDAVEPRGIWTKTLQFYTNYIVEELKSTVRVLLFYHRGAEDSKLQVVFSKYNKAKYMYASTKITLSVEDLDFQEEAKYMYASTKITMSVEDLDFQEKKKRNITGSSAKLLEGICGTP